MSQQNSQIRECRVRVRVRVYYWWEWNYWGGGWEFTIVQWRGHHVLGEETPLHTLHCFPHTIDVANTFCVSSPLHMKEWFSSFLDLNGYSTNYAALHKVTQAENNKTYSQYSVTISANNREPTWLGLESRAEQSHLINGQMWKSKSSKDHNV